MTSLSVFITSALLSNALYNIQDLEIHILTMSASPSLGTSIKQVIQSYKYSINKLPIFQ